MRGGELFRICWLICAMYLFCWLGFALSSAPGSVGLQAATCAPGLLTAAPVVAAVGVRDGVQSGVGCILPASPHEEDSIVPASPHEEDEATADSGAEWLRGWMSGFMADFRKNFDVTDRRSLNGGSMPKWRKFDVNWGDWLQKLDGTQTLSGGTP